MNASTRDRRDKLRDLFSPGTDLKRDKGRMDAYLKGGALEAVDVQRQKRLLASFSKASEVEVDPALIEQLRAIIGEAPSEYCARLLRDASMKIDGAGRALRRQSRGRAARVLRRGQGGSVRGR